MPEMRPAPARLAISCSRHRHCIDLAYHDQGQGEVLVLIHGLGANATAWRDQMAELSAACRVIAPDLRGHGDSGQRPEEPITVRAFADDVIALLKGLDVGRAHVCGNSLGGMIALEIWVRVPSLVKSLILANTTAFFPPPQMLDDFLRLFDAMDMAAFARFMAPRLLTPQAPATLVEEVVQMIEGVSRSVFRQGLVAAFQADYRWMLPLVDVPTLIVVGAEDQATPAGYARFLEKHIKDAALRVAPAAAHLPHRENSPAFNRLLREHLQSCRTD